MHVVHFGRDQAWANGVHAYAFGSDLLAQCQCEGVYRALGGCIGSASAEPAQARGDR